MPVWGRFSFAKENCPHAPAKERQIVGEGRLSLLLPPRPLPTHLLSSLPRPGRLNMVDQSLLPLQRSFVWLIAGVLPPLVSEHPRAEPTAARPRLIHPQPLPVRPRSTGLPAASAADWLSLPIVAPGSSLWDDKRHTWRTPSDAGTAQRSHMYSSHVPGRRTSTAPQPPLLHL